MKTLVWMFTILVIASLLVSGCSTTYSATSTSAPVVTTTSIPTVVQSTATTSAATATVTSPMYETKVFHPVFTVELPSGWYVAERDRGAAQIFVACKTCEHDGEENGEITLDMALSNSSPSEAMARLQMGRNIDAGSSKPVELGSLSGFKFTATRTGNGEVRFQDSGYGSESAGLPLDIYVVSAAGQTVTIFIDPHESSGSAAQGFAQTALAIVKTIRFSG